MNRLAFSNYISTVLFAPCSRGCRPIINDLLVLRKVFPMAIDTNLATSFMFLLHIVVKLLL